MTTPSRAMTTVAQFHLMVAIDQRVSQTLCAMPPEVVARITEQLQRQPMLLPYLLNQFMLDLEAGIPNLDHPFRQIGHLFGKVAQRAAVDLGVDEARRALKRFASTIGGAIAVQIIRSHLANAAAANEPV